MIHNDELLLMKCLYDESWQPVCFMQEQLNKEMYKAAALRMFELFESFLMTTLMKGLYR